MFSQIPMPCWGSQRHQCSFQNDMRTLWEQHVYWTRMFLISDSERLRDLNDTTNRLMRNPKDIANLYANFYGDEAAKNIEELLRDHLQIGGDLITALRDNKRAVANRLKDQWYQNAKDMSAYFHSINPYYDYNELLKMFDTHLDLTTQEVVLRLGGNHVAEIQAFDQVEQEALAMADYFANGILRQFCQFNT